MKDGRRKQENKQKQNQKKLTQKAKTDGVIKKENGMYLRTESLDQTFLPYEHHAEEIEEKKKGKKKNRITRQMKSNLQKERLINDVRYQE